MDENDLFERERKVLEEANALLITATDTKNSWYDHYEKLLYEFERVVSQSQKLIRLGDMMQLLLNSLKERLQIEVENHKKTQAEKEAFLAQIFQYQKTEALTTLVGGIAHDFNNMLQSILGFAEILLSGKKQGEPGYRELEIIIKTGKDGADLVKNLLAFAGHTPRFPVDLDTNHLIRDLATLITRTLPPTIEVEFNLLDSGGPTMIHADPKLIEQAIMNLAINAAEAMPDGGRLKIETRTVFLNKESCKNQPGAKPGNYVQVSVSDSGSGMDNKTLARIFEPFFSSKERGSTRGTGLGLSVAQRIVEKHGGSLTCESELGEGTTFRIFVPAIEPASVLDNRRERTSESAERKTIMVVEDTSLVAELEERFLTTAGYNVILTNNGQKAIEIYKERRAEISLVILDLLMPEMSGKDCLIELLKIDPSVKVLMASGFAPGDKLHMEISPLVKGFLNKPFSVDQFMVAVESVLNPSRLCVEHE